MTKCNDHSGCANQIETNKENIVNIYERLRKVENRPPVWASLAFAGAMAVIGWLI